MLLIHKYNARFVIAKIMKHTKEEAVRAAYILIGDVTGDVKLHDYYLINDGLKCHLEFTPFEKDGKTYSIVEMSDTAINDLLLGDPTAVNDFFPVCVR